jgi:hypothetical protein
MVDVESGKVVDFEVAQRIKESGHGNCWGSGEGKEMEPQGRMVKRWEDGQRWQLK